MLVMLFSSLGIAVCIGMASTFAFANSALKHQVSLRVISNYYGDYSTNNFNITQFPALGVFQCKNHYIHIYSRLTVSIYFLECLLETEFGCLCVVGGEVCVCHALDCGFPSWEYCLSVLHVQLGRALQQVQQAYCTLTSL